MHIPVELECVGGGLVKPQMSLTYTCMKVLVYVVKESVVTYVDVGGFL